MDTKDLAYCLIFISPIVFLLFYRRSKNFNKIKWFLFYLFSMFTVEFLNLLFLKMYEGMKFNPNFIYNIFVFFEFNLLFLFYRDISNELLTKKVITISVIVFNVLFTFFHFTFKGDVLIDFNNYIPAIGAFIISIITVMYLREFLLSDKILNYKKNIFFWITIGLLLFYLGTLPLTAAFNFLRANNGSTIKLFKIQQLLTIIMHSCFIFGLIWCRKKTT